MPDAQDKKSLRSVHGATLAVLVSLSCLASSVVGCAQGGADGEPGWSIPSGAAVDATPSEDENTDASGTGAPGPAPSNVPPSSSGLATSSLPQVGPQTSDAGFASADPEGALDSAPVGASAGDSSVDDPEAMATASGPAPDLLGDDAAEASSNPASSPPPGTDPLPGASPALGSLLITEVMFAPFGPRPQAEWFEVYNTGDSPALLSGLTIVDGSMHTHTIASDPPVVAPVNAYVLLVRDRATAIESSVPAAAIVYDYGAGLSPNQGIRLDDGSSGAVSLWNGGLELTAAPYGSWGIIALGQSVELSMLQLVGSDLAESWCYAEVPWAPGSDFGTPGAANDCGCGDSPCSSSTPARPAQPVEPGDSKRSRGSSALRAASPTKLSETRVPRRATPGKTMSHQAWT
jgi:hypothetical protein